MNKRTLLLIDSLSKNARASTKELGRKLRISQQAAHYRVNKLELDKVIKQYTTLFDGSKFGLSSYLVLLRFGSYGNSEVKKFLSDLVKHPDVIRVEEFDYTWDVLVVFSCPNNSHFNRSLKNLLEQHEGFVEKMRIMPIIVSYVFDHKLGGGKRSHEKKVVYGDSQSRQFDEIELKICKELVTNSRESVVSMAKKCDCSPQTIITRMRKLVKQGIIQEYSVLLDVEKIGFKKYFLLLGFKSLEYNAPEVNAFLASQSLVSHAHRMIGPWQLLVEIVCPDTDSCLKLVREIQKRHASSLESVELVSSRTTHKQDYLPSNLF